ncbi:MAG: DNA-processing protein DprA [Puniceicoccales bacterium]|jgi:DNA processing protein|nr:DNA-processing protein DprA [Puniceicoccales bacterium]
MRCNESNTLSQEDAFMVLNALSRIGWVTMKKLLKHYNNDVVTIFAGTYEDHRAIGLSETVSQNLATWSQLFSLEKEKEKLRKLQAEFITFESSHYPPLLKTIYDPPIGLYCYGPIRPSSNTIAIVGTRYASLYGLQVAERLGCELAERGWCVVSGFAKGIDTAAHRGALRGKGSTVGILGCSIDRIYPPENASLYAQLRQQGCLMSEFKLGSRADRMSFPRRNRILSGMSQAIVVIESDTQGGSMLTASFAVEQNRQVFAIPGRIDADMSRGCHHLIRNGATLVTCVDEILEDLHSAPPWTLKLDLEPQIQDLRSENVEHLSPEENSIYEIIKSKGPLGSSQLIEMTQLPVDALQTILFTLELQRIIVRRNDGLFEA